MSRLHSARAFIAPDRCCQSKGRGFPCQTTQQFCSCPSRTMSSSTDRSANDCSIPGSRLSGSRWTAWSNGRISMSTPALPSRRLPQSAIWDLPEQGDALCVFERAVFERPSLFRDNYSYTIKTVRTLERARRLASVWYQATLALLRPFQTQGGMCLERPLPAVQRRLGGL